MEYDGLCWVMLDYVKICWNVSNFVGSVAMIGTFWLRCWPGSVAGALLALRQLQLHVEADDAASLLALGRLVLALSQDPDFRSLAPQVRTPGFRGALVGPKVFVLGEPRDVNVAVGQD